MEHKSPYLLQPHFGQSVRMRFTLPKVGTWSPPGLPQLQSSTTKGKTPRLEVFFIPLERSWSLDVQNGLAWAIWTSTAQVMGKRRAGSQPTTKSRESTSSQRLQKECNEALESFWGGLQIWFRPHSNQRSEPWDMSVQSLGSSTWDSFGTPPWESQEKNAIRMWLPRSNAKNTIWGKVVASPEFGPWWVKWVQSRSWLVPTPNGCKMSSNQLGVGFGCRIV